ncbi:hypothetical protein PG999_010859 [Apiospora kogelbergensis]|uniref:F-box domain-containing protein n=1 Tax=Apiospora kogelbergensis TaxID=1337665 RepID=A0AAW0QBB1_9PEZI
MAHEQAEQRTLMLRELRCRSIYMPRYSGMIEFTSSLGRLNQFPPEIMLMIMRQLDLQSLSRLSRVSYQGHGFVLWCPEYQDLLTFEPKTIEALRRSHILDLHAVVDLYRVFRTVGCDFCVERGPFLFLPTAQRCCMGCLKHHPALRLMTVGQAKKWYGLTKKQVEENLRVVHVSAHNVLLDGFHRHADTAFDNFYPNHGKGLIAARARDLAIAVHGSAKRAYRNVRTKVSKKGMIDKRDAWEAAYWHGGHLRAPDYDVLAISGVEWNYYWSRPHDQYSEKYTLMATLPFQTLKLEAGRKSLEPAPLWCRACQTARAWFEDYRGGEDDEVRLHGDLQGIRKCIPKHFRNDRYSAHRTLFRLADTARSTQDFVRHAVVCPGSVKTMRWYKEHTDVLDGVDVPDVNEV